jgi:hypothetical protein
MNFEPKRVELVLEKAVSRAAAADTVFWGSRAQANRADLVVGALCGSLLRSKT